MKAIVRIVIFTGFMLMFFSCQEKKLEPINTSKEKPEPVSDAVATPAPGGAIISFVVPKDANVLGIKAVYTTNKGNQREVSASFYVNSLTLEGFNDTDEHEALLYTVSRAQVLSDPIPVRFTPLESPLSKATKSASITSDFGGACFSWENEEQVLLTVEMFAADENGELKTARIVTSTLNSDYFSVRGYEPTPRIFAAVFSDNFDNVSDTIYPLSGYITPKVEKQFDKTIMSIYRHNGAFLPGDVSFNNYEGREEFMFDDNYDTFGHSNSGSLPVSFTLDVGKPVMLSRVIIFQRKDQNFTYRWGNPRRIIIYGRLDPPVTETWDEWTELIDFTIIKPSGTNSEYDIKTDEDMQAAENGHEASFPISSNIYRYLRFTVMTSWENRPYAHPAEITLYGEYAE